MLPHLTNPSRGATRLPAARSRRFSVVLATVAIAALTLSWPASAAAVSGSSSPQSGADGSLAPGSSAPSAPGSSASSGPGAASRATFGIAPISLGKASTRGYFSYQAGPGGLYSDKVVVLNYGSKPLPLSVYPAELSNSEDGSVAVGLRQDRPGDAAGWVHLDIAGSAVVVAAKSAAGPGKVTVPFTVRIPQNASPGDHAAALVAVLSTTSKNSKGERVRLDQRVATRMFLRVRGQLRPQLSLQDLRVSYRGSLNPTGTGSATISYTVRNSGNIRLAAGQRVQVTGAFGTKTSPVSPPDIALLFPGGSQHVTVRVSGIRPTGREKALVSIQPKLFSDQPPTPVTQVTASVSFWALPIPLIALVLAVLLLAIAVILLRRRIRKRPVTGRHVGRAHGDRSASTPGRTVSAMSRHKNKPSVERTTP